MRFPLFINPEEHKLYSYYKKLNKLGFVLIFFILLINELFIRKHLVSLKDAPYSFLSLTALTLNAEFPTSLGRFFSYFFIFIGLLYLMTYFLLPKWGSRAAARIMKKGLPKDLVDYKTAYFYIENSTQKLAFCIWHLILMRISLTIGIITMCMAVNLFRSFL